jgi:putative transposase
MPSGLKRFQQSAQTHFVTFCCYHRHRLLIGDTSRLIFESALERTRRSYRLYVYGYVVMPDHVHLLLSEPQPEGGPLKPGFCLSGDVYWLSNEHPYTLADALKSLKQGVSRRLIGDAEHFWQKRYYDFNIRTYRQFVESCATSIVIL